MTKSNKTFRDEMNQSLKDIVYLLLDFAFILVASRNSNISFQKINISYMLWKKWEMNKVVPGLIHVVPTYHGVVFFLK